MNCFLDFGKVAYRRNRHNKMTAMMMIIFMGYSPYCSYLLIRSAAIMAEAVTVGTPPPGCVDAPTR